MESFVAINILNKNELLNSLINTHSYPLIYYWNGVNDFKEEIFGNTEFKNLLSKELLKIKYYDNTKIVSTFVDKEERYGQNVFDLQDILPLSEIESDFYFEYFLPTLKELYTNVYHIDYDPNKNVIYEIDYTYQDMVKDIYSKIKGGVNREIKDDTITNYIRKKLIETTNLNTENIEFIINKINSILEEES